MSTEVWNIVESVVNSCGLELFDLEIPVGPKGVMRVYISAPNLPSSEVEAGSAGVQHQHCVAVSKKILDLPDIERLLPGDVVIEVSSPGINRKLVRPEHFKGAIGEHVKLKLNEPLNGDYTVFGELLSCESAVLTVLKDGSEENLRIPLGNLQRARVDFQFE